MSNHQESILRMRWVLEYRLDENENKTPKARIVILGYLDPDSENRPAASPTMTRNTRQQLLQFGAWMGFSVAKGDVSGAFLQGRNLQRDLWVQLVPELAAALNLSPGDIMKLKKAAYGLVEAPVEWYIGISTVLKEHGWRRLKSDPCCWILIDPSLTRKEETDRVMTRSECPVVAATGGHVDDFVFVGKEGNKIWETARKKLQDHYRWKMWEHDNFLQCGDTMEHQKDGDFLLSRNEFVDELSQRRKEKDSPVTPQEQTELRGLLGGLGWKCEQTKRSGRMDRVCRSATCAETRAVVVLEDELFALRYQWSEMLGNSAVENSPDGMARLVPGACVTDSKGLYDKMQHTVITLKG